jgi:hypothetical protein
MKAFALACLAVASSAVTLEQSSCPFCQGIEKPIVHIDASVLDGAGWAATVLQPQNIASIATTSKAYSTGKVARQKGRFVDLCPNAASAISAPTRRSVVRSSTSKTSQDRPHSSPTSATLRTLVPPSTTKSSSPKDGRLDSRPTLSSQLT